MPRIEMYDTTLRDGSQGEGVYFSLEDKLAITAKLDELGFDYVEGGYPLSNPKDFEYFQRVAEMPLKNAKIAAFGMTRRRGCSAADDIGMQALRDSKAPVVTIVGKTWDLHVLEVLRVDEAEKYSADDRRRPTRQLNTGHERGGEHNRHRVQEQPRDESHSRMVLSNG